MIGLTIKPLVDPDDIEACARLMAGSEPWVTLGRGLSAFNHGARRLYERLGYEVVGELRDYIVAGHAEILLRKTRGPLAAFTPQ